jgi:hypothetical protein
MKSHLLKLFAALIVGVMCSAASAQEESRPADAANPAELAKKAQAMLKTYCYRCHGIDFKAPDLNVLDFKVLTGERKNTDPYIVAGKSGDSYLWTRLEGGDMPPENQKRPSEEEKLIIKQWIDAGAPAFPENAQRPFKRTEDMLLSIRNHLKEIPEADRKFQKYFTFAQLHNNNKISEPELRLSRAALSKLINSLSWKRNLVLPEAVDEAQTVFNLDLRLLGWEKNNLWREVQKAYPYALNYEDHEDQEVRKLSEDIIDLSGDKHAWVRADWFISSASRPPLYHLLLEMPDRSDELQRLLNVDVRADITGDLMARAGFATSLVSKQNRVVDRHFSLYGAYWESYDFKPKAEELKGNIFKFPLGPEFPGNPFLQLAFQHDGGEIIFNLPNGLQGYMLVDKDGKRIDEGPTDVVSDSLNTAGNVAVVNGLSCMACHQHGMRTFKDTMRNGATVERAARDKVQRIVPPAATMDRLVQKDIDRFLAALEPTIGPFLKVAEDTDRPITDFPEPIGAVSLQYVKDLGAEEVALELGIESASEVPGIVNGNRLLKRAGLGPLAVGGTIKRDVWSTLIRDRSPPANPFHVMAEQLEQGDALIER